MDLKHLDTYALYEIRKGNPKYKPYSSEICVICHLILAEFYGVILRECGDKEAEGVLNELTPYTKTASFNTIINAIKFKLKNKTKNFSFFDCIGYMFALENRSSFVTGDKEFVGMPSVEFVTK